MPLPTSPMKMDPLIRSVVFYGIIYPVMEMLKKKLFWIGLGGMGSGVLDLGLFKVL